MNLCVDITMQWPLPIRAQLSVYEGAVVALVGPSGAGKSSVLRAIAGLISCQGAVGVGGRDWSGLPTHRRRVGLVAQSGNLLPHLTALENIAMGIDGARRERESIAATWFQNLNLIGLEQRYPHQLSGGQQQRIAIARALARRPDVLLLDEPFSSVDSQTRRRLYETLSALRSEIRCATVLVTHDVKEAVMLSDQLVVMNRGNTLAQGPSDQMLSAPPTGEVARLLGWRNVIPAMQWRASARLTSVFSLDPSATGCVVVSQRNVSVSMKQGGIEGRTIQRFRLPHQSWVLVEVEGVRLWGILDESDWKADTPCSIDIGSNHIRSVPES